VSLSLAQQFEFAHSFFFFRRAKEAEKCFLAGAKFGNRNCMYELYQMYWTMERPDRGQALEWLLEAAAAGHTAAAEAIGSDCLTRDEELARYWLSKAPASASAKKKLATLGKEKEATMEEHLARIAAAMAKIPTGAAAKVVVK
jgi:TPR repeat protein